MEATRNGGRGRGKIHNNVVEQGEKRLKYEESRAQRIKENMVRMNSLGIFSLSMQLQHPKKPSSSLRQTKPTSAPSNDPPRRSSRLKDTPRVTREPESYTEEHEKLLGDSEAAWTLFVDGFYGDGQRIYDPIQRKTCHKCRRKTIGQHTDCSKCKIITGKFCGDCLYTRYGENVTGVNLNPDWICPVCRGICNCSRCRRGKGWAPTGPIYRTVVRLGFKSVAHYLVHTRCGQAITEVVAAGSPISADGSLSVDDGQEGSCTGLPQSNLKLDSNEE